MAETEQSQENIGAIRTRLENVERMVRFGIAADPNSKTAVEEHLRARDGAAAVYLALSDGPKSQDQLKKAARMSQANISKICKHLYQGDLISKIPDPAKRSSFLYIRSDLERILGVSRIAKKILKG